MIKKFSRIFFDKIKDFWTLRAFKIFISRSSLIRWPLFIETKLFYPMLELILLSSSSLIFITNKTLIFFNTSTVYITFIKVNFRRILRGFFNEPWSKNFFKPLIGVPYSGICCCRWGIRDGDHVSKLKNDWNFM